MIGTVEQGNLDIHHGIASHSTGEHGALDTGIRDFPATSMKYPVELDVPSFTLTTTYHRRRFGRKPRTVTYLDGPFYPDHSLPPRARAQTLRDEIYKTMVRRSQESDYEYIRYVKKEEKT